MPTNQKIGCRGRVARQWSATPSTAVRIRSTPQKNPVKFLQDFFIQILILVLFFRFYPEFFVPLHPEQHLLISKIPQIPPA